MHVALCITEVTIIIFKFLKKADVGRCTRVCRAWFDPAIEVLWGKAEPWTRIFGILGGVGLFQEREDEYDILKFSRIPSTAEWDRLYLYTSKIRSFSVRGKHSMLTIPKNGKRRRRLTPAFVQVLSNPGHTSGGPLLPRARKLTYNPLDELDVQVGQFLISHMPQLADLYISLQLTLIKDRSWPGMCSALALCTKLEEFRVHTLGHQPLPYEVFKAFGALPNVKTVDGHFMNCTSDMGAGSGISLASPLFPRLSYLRLIGNFTMEMFHDSWFPPKHLGYFGCFPVNAELLHDLVIRLSSAQSLNSLDVHVSDTLHSIHFRPISQLHTLQYLGLYLRGRSSGLSDDDIEYVVAGLPNLRTFSVHYSGFVASPRQLTLLSISHLVVHCPKLEYLIAEFDATHIPPLPTTHPISVDSTDSSAPGTPPQPKHLKISPCNSELHDPEAVASWLLHLCSTRKSVELNLDRTSGASYNAWVKVFYIMSPWAAFPSIRGDAQESGSNPFLV